MNMVRSFRGVPHVLAETGRTAIDAAGQVANENRSWQVTDFRKSNPGRSWPAPQVPVEEKIQAVASLERLPARFEWINSVGD